MKAPLCIKGSACAAPTRVIPQARPMGIEAIGADAYTFGAKTTGSLLVNRMKVAGA
ncbi:hypothetical protein [Variovorax sp. DAIF25]|jgi:hypothetical protein|uniref:hypothetical protein n=1 Tax=Variovorax sp. DAIF25 TaxID=3080983 RepID=UPI003D6A27A0